MAKWLKQAISKQDKDEAQQQVRETVEKLPVSYTHLTLPTNTPV